MDLSIPGFEPATFQLQIQRSADWATEDAPQGYKLLAADHAEQGANFYSRPD